jgi:[ribosomal protein S5]-alanine N-acetyltransferase
LLPATSRVLLERPDLGRERDFLDACRRSRELHRGVVTAAATSVAYRAYVNDAARSDRESFFVVVAATAELVGVVDILEIDRDAVPAARLGYFAFVPHAGRGLMREGVSKVVRLAFDDLGLSVLNADIRPSNPRSRALAESLGFMRNGEERSLKIGARWLAHERWVLNVGTAASLPQLALGRA